ncbi:MAG: hypothetical protein KDA24_15260 [Deltaproteobacteria bacterium]|nr:hypothetical protein [Deltaproteobacteria bacterium]
MDSFTAVVFARPVIDPRLSGAAWTDDIPKQQPSYDGTPMLQRPLGNGVGALRAC